MQIQNISSKPIGVFDSGVGGLSNVKGIIEALPNENIIFFGDNARVPYGNKSAATIKKFTQQIVQFLLEQEVKAIVIACNTISATAKDIVLQMANGIPIIDVISSGSLIAVETTQNNNIGVIATLTTIASNAYQKEIHRLNPVINVISQACPLFVPFVEENLCEHPALELIAQDYLKSLVNSSIDSLILGCTHYPLLKPIIKKICGNNIQIIDSVTTTANQLKNILSQHNLLYKTPHHPEYRYYVTDVPLKFQTIGERFLNRSMTQLELVSLE